jgi:hypothetical protein
VKNLYGAIQSHIDKFESELFTSLPATVTSFDPKEQTISARPVMLEPYKDGTVLEFAEIQHIPVIFPSAGGGSLTFPIQVGDEVLLQFSSRSFDSWWDTSSPDILSSTQRYNELTDAIAIVGLTSKSKSVLANAEDVELKFNDNSILLKKDGTIEVVTKSTVSVTNGTEELISLLSETIQAISEITTNTIYGISPINNINAILTLKDRLDTFKK